MRIFLFLLVVPFLALASPKVYVGIDVLMGTEHKQQLYGKKIGLVTNHTAVNRAMVPTHKLLEQHAHRLGYQLVALFAPEHGLQGANHAGEAVKSDEDRQIPLYSLHGKTRRPTEEMLQGMDTLIYDIQDIGSRSYTYTTTLFYVMEEAAKRKINVIVLDRPNPINGLTVDGPVLEEKWRSFVGYLNVPYCHGMTIGELARYFNAEYQISCALKVIPMQGWKRPMTFKETGLPWIPTSPHIPEPDTPFYYPTTGIIGELQIVNIGIGYTLPFKLVGAPWINAEHFAKSLNEQKFPGVHFHPLHYRPFYGKYEKKECQGVLITITDPATYKPVTTQYLILGILKSLYPKQFAKALEQSEERLPMFHKVNGTDKIYHTLKNHRYIVWALKHFHDKERQAFLQRRKPYLIRSYGEG